MKILVEPYFIPANSDAFLAKDVSWIADNQNFRQSQKYFFYRNILDYLIENNLAGSYFEFGVHKARTFTMVMSLDAFYATNKGPHGKLIPKTSGGYFDQYFAFDSFEGFPVDTVIDEHPHYREGHVKTSQEDFLGLLSSYGQSTERVTCIPGFYKDSLDDRLSQILYDNAVRCTLATIDCNLYDSYRSSLAFLDRFLVPGSVVYLDDYNTHQSQESFGPKRAWREYRSDSHWIFEDFLSVGWAGRSFVVCGRKGC